MGRNSLHYTLMIITIFIMCLVVVSTSAGAVTEKETTPGDQEYTLEAQEINYDAHRQLVQARGQAVFSSEELEITAEEIVVDIESNLARARGEEVVLTTPDQRISGDNLEYNYEQSTGTLYGARSSLDEINFKGHRVNLVQGEDYRMEIDEASFTPCILPDPHYHIKADSVKVYPGDKVVGEQLVLWWGKLPVMYLPYYVMKYDEETGKLVNTGPATDFGYDSDGGFFAEITYPYQLTAKSQGEIYYKRFQEGDTVARFSNNTEFTPNTSWQTNYDYQKGEDEDDYQVREETLTSDLSHRVNSDLSLEARLNYFHDYEEEDDDFDREALASVGSRFQLTPNLKLLNFYKYRRKYDRDGDYTTNRLVSTAFRYRVPGVNLNTDFDYNLDQEYWENTLNLGFRPAPGYHFNLHQYYEDRYLDEQSYSVNSSAHPVNWRLRYREGYDEDYLPYLDLSFPELFHIKPGLGLGRVYGEDEMLDVKKARLNLDYSQGLELTSNFRFKLRENFTYNYYYEPEADAYSGLTSELSGSYNRQLKENLSLQTSLGWEKTMTRGNYLLESEEIEEEEVINTSIGLTINTEAPQSAWILKNDNEYDLETETWEEQSLGITRQLDCYSMNFNYDFADQRFSFSLEL